MAVCLALVTKIQDVQKPFEKLQYTSKEKMNTLSILDIVKKLYPYAYSVVSSENDRAISAFLSELPFDVIEFSSGSEHNGWLIPNDWHVVKANIYKKDELILDAKSSPLGIGILSPSFNGVLSLAQLKKHLYFSSDCPKAIPYHWKNLYRPAEPEWAFCVDKTFYDSLEDGEYHVELETKETPSTLKVFDFVLPGENKETILLNGHNCHPWQANDDISGCAVGIAIMQILQRRKKRKHTYRLVIAPELIGTVHWLASLDQSIASDIIGAVMLKSVGNERQLKLQYSYLGDSQLDKASNNILRRRDPDLVSGAFRTVYGNDETVFDSPGFEIPSISLTRFPFKEYHTDADTPEILSEEALVETRDIVLEIIEALEENETLSFKEKGLVSLSHPRYDLYRAAPAPGMDREEYLEISSRWNLLMNCLPRELDGQTTSIDLADKYNLPVDEVCEYLKQWRDKGLAV